MNWGQIEFLSADLNADDVFRSICVHPGNELREKYDNMPCGYMTTTVRLACMAGSHTPVETF